ncbi:MAG: nucleotidyltransferase domain-containing protein [Elusimicrobiota bacterium]
MAKREIIKTKDLLLKLFRTRKIHLDKIVIFGSSVKKTFRSDSDIDIILVSRDFRNKDIFARVSLVNGIHSDIVERINRPIDLMFYSDQEWEKGNSIIMNTAKNEGLVFSV